MMSEVHMMVGCISCLSPLMGNYILIKISSTPTSPDVIGLSYQSLLLLLNYALDLGICCNIAVANVNQC